MVQLVLLKRNNYEVQCNNTEFAREKIVLSMRLMSMLLIRSEKREQRE